MAHHITEVALENTTSPERTRGYTSSRTASVGIEAAYIRADNPNNGEICSWHLQHKNNFATFEKKHLTDQKLYMSIASCLDHLLQLVTPSPSNKINQRLRLL